MKRRLFKECSRKCLEHNVSCPIKDCRMWIDYEEDLNCTNVSIAKNGAMTLRQVAERHKLSFVRIQQIEKKALKKLKSKMQK